MSKTMKEVQRNQTILGTLVNGSEIRLLQTVGKSQKGVLNLTFNSFSGINRYQDVFEKGSNYLRTVILGLENVNKKIDDEYKRVCVEKAVGNIKSNWTNSFKKVKSAIRKNENLSELDRRYLYTVMKIPEIFQKIIARKGKVDYQGDKYLKQFYGEVETKRLNNLLRRYVRKYKSETSYTKKDTNIYLNKNLYSLDKKKEMKSLKITTTSQNRGKRSEIKLSTYFYKTKRMIQISIQKDNTLKIFVPYIKQVHKYFKKEQELGLDIGMRDILALSNGNSYGMNSTEIFYDYSDSIIDKNRNRNRLYAYYRECLEKGKTKKAENILKNNLGSIKRDRQLNKKKSHCKSMINQAIREMIKYENLAYIIKEDLTWKSDKKNIFSKKQRNRFNTWLKGYIIERLENYFELYEIPFENVNPAYTSQICHKCKKLGKRRGEWFYCEEHGRIPSDTNAAVNIKDRKYEKHITLNMTPKQVKAFYL